RGVHHVLATAEEMEPGLQQTFVQYWTGIDELGPQVGERFMVAWLRAGRDFVNAMEYGIDEDAVVDVLTRETGIKDPAVHRQSNGRWPIPRSESTRDGKGSRDDYLAQLLLLPPEGRVGCWIGNSGQSRRGVPEDAQRQRPGKRPLAKTAALSSCAWIP